MARRTKAECEATRSALLDAAEAVFLEQGVSRTSLEQIARHAGMTRGALYWHFKDKDALFEALRQRAQVTSEELLEHLSSVSDHSDPLEALHENFTHVFTVLSQPRVQRIHTILLFRREFYDKIATGDNTRDITLECLDRLTHTLERMQQAGYVLTCPPDIAARAIHSTISGLIHEWLRAPESFNLRDEGRCVMEWTLSHLLPTSCLPKAPSA